MIDAVRPHLRPGRDSDLPRIQPLLAAAGLPTSDLATVGDLRTWLLEAEGRAVGAIALELHGNEGLLRSLALAPEFRGQGLGRELVRRLEIEARALGLRRLTLLTETAEGFFRGIGYQRVDRAKVGAPLQLTAEFRMLCPASATCMSKNIVDSPEV